MIFLLLFVGCGIAMAVALYMEHVMGMEPCPLCIFQRVMVIAAGGIGLVAGVHNPHATGIRIYALLLTVAAVIGGLFAGRQLWLQSLPKDQVPACGPGLDYLMDVFSFVEVFEMVLAGDGACAEVHWVFLGLSIPGWTMVGFVGLAAIGLALAIKPGR
ncbi:MAG: disulfide bond formation protein B [Gammaproteobacteria bacterium]|nr:disulfide bond formation protein B [Gammaproteobacteria bacterium]